MRMYLEDYCDEEFACWVSAGKVTKEQQGKMPQELPTSVSVPVGPHQNLITAQSKTMNVSTANTLLISKETVFTSVCESILSNSATHANHLPKTIDLVIVPSHTSTSKIPGPTTTTTTTTTACQYKLSEIVSREKDVLFQTEEDPDSELEPARHDVYSVRRRSRQFFTVTEEEENDSEIDSQITKSDAVGEKEQTIEVQPVFNLGDSLKKLYFPHQHKTQGKRKRKDRANKKSNVNTDTQPTRGYESDPEGRIGLCDIIRNHPELKGYNSHPELNWSENMIPDDTFAVRQTKSLPNTPRVSPKLLRRNSLKNENQGELQKAGPGFSFLASVAGELHKKKIEQDKKLEKGVVKVNPETMVVGPRPAEKLQVTVQPQTMASVSHYSEPSTGIHTHHMHDFSDSAGIDLESHKPAFISSFMKWGTNTKINVTNKESNMFSPTSF